MAAQAAVTIGSPRATSIMARSVSAPHERPEIRVQSELAVAFGVRNAFSRGELIRARTNPGLLMIAKSGRPARLNLRARCPELHLSRSRPCRRESGYVVAHRLRRARGKADTPVDPLEVATRLAPPRARRSRCATT